MSTFQVKFVQTDGRTTVKQYAPDLSIWGHKKTQESMDRCTGRHDVIEILLKTVLNTIQSIIILSRDYFKHVCIFVAFMPVSVPLIFSSNCPLRSSSPLDNKQWGWPIVRQFAPLVPQCFLKGFSLHMYIDG